VITASASSTALAQPAEPPIAPAEPPTPTPPQPVTPPPPPPPAQTVVVPVVAPDSPKEDKKDKDHKDKLPLEVKVGGYAQFDARRFLNESKAHELTIRRLRFKLDGSASKYFKFRTLIDFAGSKVVVDDAWLEAVVRPELSIRAGKDKSQFGIERLQSATQLTFVERAYPTQLAPNRDIGVWLRGDIEKGLLHYAFGAVDGVANSAVIEGETDDVLEFNAHLLVSPFAKNKQLGDLGLGAATTFGRTKGTILNTGLTNIRSAGQTTIVKFATGTDLPATAVADGYRTRWTAHGYYYRGPIGVLAEYVRDREPVQFAHSHELLLNDAWQIAASAALTPGDRPTYKSIKPKHAFDPEKGTYGAVELAARYSGVRFDSGAFSAGITKAATSFERANELTIGANWYLNEYLKLQLDYSFTSFTSNDATVDPPAEHLLATRFQVSI
jgi:phosphate-selective porin OprO/OprP